MEEDVLATRLKQAQTKLFKEIEGYTKYMDMTAYADFAEKKKLKAWKNFTEVVREIVKEIAVEHIKSMKVFLPDYETTDNQYDKDNPANFEFEEKMAKIYSSYGEVFHDARRYFEGYFEGLKLDAVRNIKYGNPSNKLKKQKRSKLSGKRKTIRKDRPKNKVGKPIRNGKGRESRRSDKKISRVHSETNGPTARITKSKK